MDIMLYLKALVFQFLHVLLPNLVKSEQSFHLSGFLDT
jgi:hypothetical protein